MDLTQIVDPETGDQMQTVGSHWGDASRPLNEDQRTRVERTGVCMGCHQNMADPEFWDDKVVAKFGTVATTDEHVVAMNEVLNESVASPDMAGESSGASEDELMAAEEQVKVAEADAAEAEARAEEAESALADAEAPVQGGSMSVWTILALVLGLVVGAGSIWFLRRK